MTDPVEIPLSPVVLAALLGLAVLTLGWANTPLDASRRPVLLLPDVKAVSDYQRSTSGWIEQFHLLDGGVSGLLDTQPAGLFSQARTAQEVLERALRLSQEIDRQAAPLSLSGLQSAYRSASAAYLDACRLALRWVSLQDPADWQAAQQSLADARAEVEKLEANQWLLK